MDEELIRDLESFERGESPSPFGELTIQLERGPVSQQSARARKDEMATALRASFDKYQFYLTGEIQLELEWLIHARVRYESDRAADVDNILKPTLDALTGPDGIMIDDCQIQAVTSAWMDWTLDSERLTLRFRHGPDDYIPRSALAFVDIGWNLFMPVNTDLTLEARQIMAEAISAAVSSRDRLVELGADYYSSRSLMPMQRVFHRSRIDRGFRIGSLAAYADGTL